MADDRQFVVQMNRQIFRTASERRNAPPGETLRKTVGKGKAQIGTTLFDPFDGRTFHDGLQTAANRFDLW